MPFGSGTDIKEFLHISKGIVLDVTEKSVRVHLKRTLAPQSFIGKNQVKWFPQLKT